MRALFHTHTRTHPPCYWLWLSLWHFTLLLSRLITFVRCLSMLLSAFVVRVKATDADLRHALHSHLLLLLLSFFMWRIHLLSHVNWHLIERQRLQACLFRSVRSSRAVASWGTKEKTKNKWQRSRQQSKGYQYIYNTHMHMCLCGTVCVLSVPIIKCEFNKNKAMKLD